MAVGERPQERLQRSGPKALSDSELLAMLLRSGTQGADVITVAERLIASAGSLADLVGWSAKDFSRHKGIGHIKALQMVTVMEVARRVLAREHGAPPVLDNPGDIADYCRPAALGLAVEKFWVLCLNRKNRLIRRVEVTSGTAGSTLVHPREVFREAIREAASAVVRVTRVLREAARTIDIPLLDHVIVGQAQADPTGLGYYSFRDAGVL
jgi:DNA repair protein RadC